MTLTRDFEGRPAEHVDDGYVRRTARGRGFRSWFARTVLRLGGWKIGGPPPTLDKYVIIAAPHTTWFDGFWMLAFAWSWGIELAWMGKASLTKGPLGWIPRKFGVIPIERSSPQGLVAQMVDQFAARETLLLAIPPEGTRSRREWWKSGFYQIARMADVPICMSYLDYKNHEAGFGPIFAVGDDIVADMDRVRAFYKAEWGKHPELFTPPRLQEETMSPVVELPRGRTADEPERVREAAQG